MITAKQFSMICRGRGEIPHGEERNRNEKAFSNLQNAASIRTTAVVNAMLFNENRNEIMRELLCGSHQNIYVEIDAAIDIVKKFGNPCTEYLLCHKHGLFVENEQVLKEVVPQDTDIADGKARGMLLSALADGYLQTVKLMLACDSMRLDIHLYLTASNPKTLTNRCKILEWFIWYGPTLHNTALMRPFQSGGLGASTLLENKTHINTVNDMGKTPLILAVHLGDYYMVGLLLKRGADITMSDGLGRTAEDWAYISGHLEIAILFDE